MLRPHIVILGAGFGGTYAAKCLAPLVKKGEIDVTIVNKTNYFLFTPLLHEVATGSLTPTSVAEPLREIFVGTNIELCQGTVDSIDKINRRVHIQAGGSRHTLVYDYLIIATGAETNYYGISGAEQNTLPLKDLDDAARIRTQIIDSFEKANAIEDPNERAHLLSFAIIGGGPSGVETAAELMDFIDTIIKRYRCARSQYEVDEPNVYLIHGGTKLLDRFPPSLQNGAEERLNENGVTIVLGRMVTSVTPKGITLSDGTFISAATVIWTAGVKSIIPPFEGGEDPKLVEGRLAVDQFFHMNGEERIFAIGDVAGYIEEHEQRSAPMLAQVAVQQADVAAYNIIASIKEKKLKDFHFHSKGRLVSVGQWFAVGEIYFMKIAGPVAWWVWRMVYLFKFASWSKRIRIAFEWSLALFYPRDVTKLT